MKLDNCVLEFNEKKQLFRYNRDTKKQIENTKGYRTIVKDINFGDACEFTSIIELESVLFPHMLKKKHTLKSIENYYNTFKQNRKY